VTIKAFRHCLSICILIAICLTGTAPIVHAAELDRQKKVLILNSYHSGYKGSDDIMEGFNSVLLKSLPETEIQVEYLDSKHYKGKDFDNKVLELLRFKYQQRHFDLIFSADDYSFDILDRHRQSIFGTTPVVFCGTNSFDSSRILNKHGMVGIDERPSFNDTLDLVFRHHPTCRNIVVIHDDSITGRLNGSEFRKASERFEKRAEFSYLVGRRLDDLVGQVKQLQANSVIIYFASFVEDKTGERVSSGEALKMISASSSAPVYGGWEFNLGKGIVGGRLINLHEHGAVAATMAVRILRGESPDSLPRLSPSPNQYMFDSAEMKRFRVLESQLPAGSMVINKPPGYLWTYRVEILETLSGILLITLAAIFIQLVKSRKTLKADRDKLANQNSELEDALSKVKQLEGLISICMYCKKIQNDEKSWQQMETYISQHSEAQFTHGLCPQCFEDLKKGITTKTT